MPIGSELTRLLGLDIGTKRIGVALSDPLGFLAAPLLTIDHKNKQKDIEKILEIARTYEVSTIVVGLPISLDGNLWQQGQKVLGFAEMLRKASPTKIDTWDERFTSAEAEKLIREAGGKPSKNKSKIDSVAAALILQSYLNSREVQSP